MRIPSCETFDCLEDRRENAPLATVIIIVSVGSRRRGFPGCTQVPLCVTRQRLNRSIWEKS